MPQESQDLEPCLKKAKSKDSSWLSEIVAETLAFFYIKSFHLAKEDVDDIELAILPAPCRACQNDSFESMDFVDRAFQHAGEMAEISLGKQTKEVEKKEHKKNAQVNKKKVRKQIQKDDKSCWWTFLDVTSCPLQMFYDDDLAKNKTTSKKNFASRVYHKVDKIGSRAQARAAHQAALEFCSWNRILATVN